MSQAEIQPADKYGHEANLVIDGLTGQDPGKRRIRQVLRTLLIEHDRFKGAHALLKEALDSAGDGREGDSYLLFGPSGAGKSMAIETFCNEYENRREAEDGSGVKQDVLYIEIPSRPYLNDFYRATLEALGADDDVGTLPAMQRAFLAQVRGMGVRLVIFDEFNNFVEDRTDRFKASTAREIKSFLSKNLFNAVFAGTEEIVEVYGRYRQTRRRGNGEFEMTPFDWNDEYDRLHWRQFLESISEDLPTKTWEPITNHHLLQKLHRSSGGLSSGLMKLLTAATLVAWDRDSQDVVREEDFWHGYQRLKRVLGNSGHASENPFEMPNSGVTKKMGKRRIPRNEDKDASGLIAHSKVNIPEPSFGKR